MRVISSNLRGHTALSNLGDGYAHNAQAATSQNYLFPDLTKHLNALVHFLECPVYLRLQLSIRSHDDFVHTSMLQSIMRDPASKAELQ